MPGGTDIPVCDLKPHPTGFDAFHTIEIATRINQLCSNAMVTIAPAALSQQVRMQFDVRTTRHKIASDIAGMSITDNHQYQSVTSINRSTRRELPAG